MRMLARYIALLLALTSCAWAVRWERDDTGRSVAVPDQVHRVVSLSPSLTNTVYALGAQSLLVGITNYTVYPPEAAREKPSVGDVVNPSLEKIVALHPDLVLALPEFNGAATIEGLQRIGIPVFLFNTGNIANIYRTVENVGRVMGREREATALIASLRAREAKVRAQSAGKPKPYGAAGAVDRPADHRREERLHHPDDRRRRRTLGDRRSPAGLAANECRGHSAAQAGLHPADERRPGEFARTCNERGLEIAGSGAAQGGSLSSTIASRFRLRWPSMDWKISRSRSTLCSLTEIAWTNHNSHHGMFGKRGEIPPLPRNCNGQMYRLSITTAPSGKVTVESSVRRPVR